jgi:hypothetical protein
MRLAPLALIAMLAAAGPAVAQVPVHPDSALDQRLGARLPAEARAPVRAIIDSARAQGLPTEPLVQKALEGASRRAESTRILRAVSSLAERMRTARSALGSGSSETELVAAAGALSVGVADETLRDLRRSQPDRSVALPLVVLADIVQRGVPLDTASAVIMSLSRAGMRETDFQALRLEVVQDIGSGANPAVAASTRARGILLRVRTPAPPPLIE